MQVELERCPVCGGGPVSQISWERTGRTVVPVKTRCDNCGHVSETAPDERRVIETV